ncbi:hypothetical protein BGZ94_005095 [Podila epigama]|nr:hypothetical protein BGZ94_005095 [Podila epigama]
MASSTLTKAQIKDRIRGCLLGNAVGDAYGLATEFMSKDKARERYGNGPIQFGTETEGKWNKNDFTDDTDQLLLLLQCLQQTQDGRLHPILFAKRLKEWSRIGSPELGTPPRGIGFTVGSTLSHPSFESNPHRAAFDIWDSKGRTLAANGAVMRTAVLGIESFWDEHRVVINTLAAAKVTHADPRSIVCALCASVLISRLLRGGGNGGECQEPHHWNPRLGTEEYELELLKYLRRGTDIDGGASVEPEYEAETPVSQFKEKDVEAIKQAQRDTTTSIKSSSTIETGAASTAAAETASSPFRQTLQKAGKAFIAMMTPSSTMARKKKEGSVSVSIDSWNENRPKVVLRESIGWAGIDAVGEDATMTALARSVISDYKFLLLRTDVVPHIQPMVDIVERTSPPMRSETTGEEEEEHKTQQRLKVQQVSIHEKWLKELESHCFPESLSALELEDGAKMGYTFKCIGIGYYGVTRRQPEQQMEEHTTTSSSSAGHRSYEGPQGLFRGVMEQLTLEAGDADTNGAVAGSLLGARFGLEEGIPPSWWKGLVHLEWLIKTIDDFSDRVLEAYESENVLQQD